MRPAGRGELESLYFDYPEYPFRAPAELGGASPRHPVIIAGAGPVGLTAALALAQLGVASVVVDRKNTVNDGSRAICISRYSFETLQQLGVVARFEAKGLGWTSGRCYFRDQLIYQFSMPHSADERFLPMYNLQQQYIEQYLIDAAADCPGLIDIRWLSEVTAVTQDEAGVELGIATPQGNYPLRGQYLLAADGARSEVRNLLGLRLNGRNLPGNYVIADIRMEHDFPTERRSFFESSANPEATILIHRQPDNIWRVDWQLPAGADPEEAVAENTVRDRVAAILAMIGHRGDWELEWWSIYTANTLCLDDYRHGRVLFIGDSGHIVPIFGVRGLNNGIADAANAAWKLAYTLQHGAAEGLLDSFTPERRGATLDVFRNAGKSSRFMTPPTRGYSLMRKAVLELALSEKFVRPFADPRQVQPWIYDDSPLTSTASQGEVFPAGPPPGAPLQNTRLGERDFLLDYIGPGFTLLYFAGNADLDAAAANLLPTLRKVDPRLRVLVVGEAGSDPIAGDESIADPGRHLADCYGAGPGTLYLVRPDRHIAGRWRHLEESTVTAALHRALGDPHERDA
ncbi:FAD-dependent monooxygenase [Haliea sp. E1-2-M8]|uniref:FAD-dependent monooxygenase n=1 Tax=Haliea sp. E1-2-M8 TaxID=3064706 RepID=UPI00271CAE2B|nr:FAD-dependent monooxygenase [Haliea sp. E1-2-M8]MDO8861952.1 FAD-dependent monooxygenase [Haliea sp. E1-2-M8]